ncbi:hypothetical protein D5F01_LYC19019 [Larimichthys crocea]|uniref:Uncharacterized protein n=1 Tax=Larimichthys crocea TaxID=215358 RepID=A0A6G0HXA9_LARCR|nr:hypothetical protein D5F01_LYC19019 [Larimichthys crocea]
MAVMAGLVAVLAILYHYGCHPWALTHTRVQHGTTKTVQQACWTVESRTILMEWDKNQTWLNLTTRRQEGEWVNWLAALNGTETKLDTAKNGNASNGTEVLQALQQIEDGELMLQAGSEELGWYCTWGCRPLAGLENQGYWEEEVIFPAPPQNDTCPAALPKWTFWGSLNLTCDLTSSRAPKNWRPEEKDSTTKGTDCNDAQASTTSTPDESPEPENTSSPGTTPPPGTAAPVRAPMQESTLKLIDPGFEPKEGPYLQWLRNVTRDCVYKQLKSLNPCFWNTGKKCHGQNYMVVTPATRPLFMDQKGAYGTIPNAYHEDWLNNTLPWIWVIPLWHFVGAFPEGQRWTGLGLKGPYQTDMYVQKVPRPNDLTSVPSGDFQNVDRCEAEKIFQDLNNTVFVSDGCARVVILSLWGGVQDLAVSLFATYMLGRLTISTDRKGICQGTAIVFWMILDTANIFYPPLKIASTLCEALIIIGVLSHVAYLTTGLQERGRRRWLIKLVAAILWCLGWGVIAILYWMKRVNQIVVVMWLMTYAAFFPRSGTTSSPGPRDRGKRIEGL